MAVYIVSIAELSPAHCKLLQLENKLQGKAVTHSEKLEWGIILMVDCVAILLYTIKKWLHNPPLK